MFAVQRAVSTQDSAILQPETVGAQSGLGDCGTLSAASILQAREKSGQTSEEMEGRATKLPHTIMFLAESSE
jgi:hypothetical protein